MQFLRLLEGFRHPILDWIHQGITYFGEQVIILILIMAIYWCLDRRKGIFLMYVVIAGSAVNNLLKGIFCVARPWVRDPSFTIVESAREGAGGYSFPSGHTQAAGSCYFGIARICGKKWLKYCMIALALLVGLSRMHLGVHTPADVFVSLGIAAVIVLITAPLFKKWEDEPAKWMLPLFSILGALCLLQLLHQSFFPLKENADPANSAHALETAYKVTGLSIGMMAGIYLEETKIRFRTDAVWWVQVLKLVVGLLGLLAIQKGLKTPLSALTGGHPAAHLIRYMMVAFWGTGLWPALFRYFPEHRKSSADR